MKLSRPKQAILKALRIGSEDMVQQLHTNYNSSLLCGYVPNETLSSLLYLTAKMNANTTTSIDQNKDDNNNTNDSITPIQQEAAIFRIPPSFHAPKRQFSPSVVNTLDADNTDTPTSNPTTIHLKQLIREMNFHLLHLARPEALLSCRNDLPLAYVKEYMLNQEHFNILAFLHHLINRSNDNQGEISSICIFRYIYLYIASHRAFHLIFSNSTIVSKKWCIFTRTCGSLLRLRTSGK